MVHSAGWWRSGARCTSCSGCGARKHRKTTPQRDSTPNTCLGCTTSKVSPETQFTLNAVLRCVLMSPWQVVFPGPSTVKTICSREERQKFTRCTCTFCDTRRGSDFQANLDWLAFVATEDSFGSQLGVSAPRFQPLSMLCCVRSSHRPISLFRRLCHSGSFACI